MIRKTRLHSKAPLHHAYDITLNCKNSKVGTYIIEIYMLILLFLNNSYDIHFKEPRKKRRKKRIDGNQMFPHFS